MTLNETAVHMLHDFTSIINIGTYVLGGAAGLYLISTILQIYRVRKLEKTVKEFNSTVKSINKKLNSIVPRKK